MPFAIIENRAVFSVSGPDAEHFLHNLVTADIEGLPSGKWRPSALLTAQGKVQFAFLVARNDVGFLIDCDGRDVVDLHKRLKFYRLRAKVELADPVPVAAEIKWDQIAPLETMRDSRFANSLVWRRLIEPHALSGIAGWDALRIRFGIAEPHMDYAYGDIFPHDMNLDQIGGVSFKKGCYVGQEVVSRMQHRSTARWRVMVAISQSALVAGSQIMAGGKPAGHIGTVCGNQALALVRLDRIRTAFDSGAPVVAGDAAIAIKFPENVTFFWPANTQEG
jgi:folate-binding protein YgfZ